MSRRWVEWHINWREDDYEVIRYENGCVIQVAVCADRQQAWGAYEMDRAYVLADPCAVEAHSLEYRMK